jgi:hypothetical protein
LVGEALEHGEVGPADQVAVLDGDAGRRAVAEPDGAVGVLVGFVAAADQRLAERRKDLVVRLPGDLTVHGNEGMPPRAGA